jgi:hypothetical protein
MGTYQRLSFPILLSADTECRVIGMIRRYTTREVAKEIGVGHQTLLRWLYAKQLAEPERMKYGGQNLRLWTKDDLKRARKYKVEGAAKRQSRKGTRRPKKK